MVIVKSFGRSLLICSDRFDLCKQILEMREKRPSYELFAMYQSHSSVTERELKMYLCASPYKNRPNSPGEEGNKILFYPFLTCAVGVSESILHCARSSTHTEEKICASPCQWAEGCDTACCRPASVAVLPTLRLPQSDAFLLFLAHNTRGELRQN